MSAGETMKNRTTIDRKSDCEIAVSRTINGPPRLVFEAWTRAELFQRWWVPKSAPITLVSCEMDVRVGGGYRLVFSHGTQTMAFFGKYLEVVAPSRLSWTNEEGGPDAVSITTVTFEDRGEKTHIVLTERHPSKEALDGSGSAEGLVETFDQLEEFIAANAQR